MENQDVPDMSIKDDGGTVIEMYPVFVLWNALFRRLITYGFFQSSGSSSGSSSQSGSGSGSPSSPAKLTTSGSRSSG